MKYLNEIKDLLLKIQRTRGTGRAETIAFLQNKIWDEYTFENEELSDIFNDLAGDLNFYESEAGDRDESLGYYGENELQEKISTILKKL